MYLLFAALLLLAATAAMFASGHFAKQCTSKRYSNEAIGYQLCYQPMLVAVALIVLFVLYLFYPETVMHFWHFGNIERPLAPVVWLGITGEEGWLHIALIVTAATVTFVWWQGRQNGAQWRHLWGHTPWIVLFSLTNAFSEEVIFRLGVIVPLFSHTDGETIMLFSAAAFGIVHYRGIPSGVTGVVMAGVLGWLLAKSILETEGLFWAFGIHFVQDLVVISAWIFFQNSSKRTTKA